MMTNETQKTKFLCQLKAFGFKKFLLAPDFLIALGVLFLMIWDKYSCIEVFVDGNGDYVIAIIAAAAGLFAITLAALAIILSFSSSEFVGFLRKKGKFNSILFLFWLGNGAHLVAISLSLVYLLLNNQSITSWLYPFIVATFVYALINTFYILATIIRFGYFIEIFEKYKREK